ncbi:TolC family protein [Caenibius sp. WL]|uniref:TolC family protein n=1 Tax=Caenibius sp. WL TaxID=2872646 RepID=UPI001C999D84|nr:TolC family protein [Caenibius sp. WL]QZP08940.1 TolC family protein [Caenibius sp. WL]
MDKSKLVSLAAAALLCGVSAPALGQAVSMRDAIAVAMDSNPDIIQAQMNTEAIQAERKQAQGLFAPRVTLDASAGARRLENTTRRRLGIADDWLYPLEASLNAEWVAVDFGRRRGELLRQAARVDGASLRVLERSQFVALQIARQYLDILLQQRILAASQDNSAFHRSLVGDLSEGVRQGSISIADQQQAEERLQAALVREQEAAEALRNAKISLRALTGLDIEQVALPDALTSALPANEAEAVNLVRTQNPKVLEAVADVDATNALVKAAKGDLYPEIGVNVQGRVGEDIDGFKGNANDVQARVFLRWDIFDGGINRAKVQEMVRRASEARYRLHQVERDAEQDVRTAWNAMESQTAIVRALEKQGHVTDDLLLSYRSQFNVGRRSLLDVLDAQNTRYNVQVRLETSRFSQMFAQYQTLATTNLFIGALNVSPGAGAGMKERERFHYGPPVPAELYRRVYPK